jgi:hypothetical protein
MQLCRSSVNRTIDIRLEFNWVKDEIQLRIFITDDRMIVKEIKYNNEFMAGIDLGDS